MESKKQPTLVYIFPPAPTTVRGESSHLNVSKDGTKIAYPSANNIIIRNLDDPTKVDIYTDHIADTTTASWAPSGFYIASGDVKGNLRVWDTTKTTHVSKKVWENLLPGKLKDISWSADSKLLAAVGEGNLVFGKPLNVDTGSGVGDITGHSGTLLSVAFKPERPYRLFTAGEDKTVNYYEGTPFKFKRSHNSVHNQFITVVRFNPKGDIAVSGSSDKKLVAYDGTTGDVITTISEKAHDGTISSIAFVDDDHFITSSMDKTLKMWSISEKIDLKLYAINDAPQLCDMQVGVAVFNSNSNLISLSLDGTLNIWKNFKDAELGARPDARFPGHNAGLAAVIYSETTDRLVSADVSGKILLWQGIDCVIPKGKGHEKKLQGIALSACGEMLYSIALDDRVRLVSLKNAEYVQEAEIKAPTCIAASKTRSSLIFVAVASRKVIYVLDELKIKSEIKIEYEPTALEVSHEDRLYVGAHDGTVHVIDIKAGTEIKKFLHYSGARVTALAFSKGKDSFLATGDSKGLVKLWAPADDDKLITDEWCYHSTTVSGLSFNSDNTLLLSTSHDNRAYVWNTQTLKKEHELIGIHKNGVTGGVFIKGKDIITAGGDNLLKHFVIPE
eukprot:CAMPEP_0176417006 /NCGR_PEP_ID=MMETSP0127-20121128/6651_1 /TAXON_ID=938130 /ORGANISM="Platyophrya macrostoma, Strain WH" /LENGTH=614 /DNA_ID=CAMNT_0017797123 /DNA_START=27 /DNA_END=1871 /DNA_ORIENTATION=-